MTASQFSVKPPAWVKILVVLVAVASGFWFFMHTEKESWPALTLQPPEGEVQESWYALYCGEEKVGFTYRTEVTGPNGRRFVRQYRRYRMKLGDGEARWSMAVMTVLDAGGNVLESEMLRDDLPVRGHAVLDNREMLVDWVVDGVPYTERLILHRQPVLLTALGGLPASVLADERRTVQIFDPWSLELVFRHTDEAVLSPRLSHREQGQVVAESFDEPAVDVIERLRKPAFSLANARERRSLRVHVEGGLLQELDAPPWQRVVPGGLAMEVPLFEEFPRLAVRDRRPEFSQWLQAERALPVGHEGLTAEVERLLNGVPDRRAAVRVLVRHVAARLKYKVKSGPPSVLASLRSGVGDCKTSAALFVSLARTAGIPSRMVHGLIYLDGHVKSGFYPHAWAEVYMGETLGWVPVDPAFGQSVADATHIKLSWPGGPKRSLEKLEQIVLKVADSNDGDE